MYHIVVTLLWQPQVPTTAPRSLQAFFVALVRFSEPGLLLALLTVLNVPRACLQCFSSRQASHSRGILHGSASCVG